MSIKVSELTTRAPVATDNLLLESASYGTSKASVANIVESALSAKGVGGLGGMNNAAAHNAIYRGKNLTSVYTIEQISEKLQSGDFSDLFIGDYITKAITVDGNTYTANWAIADFDYWNNMGDTAPSGHHAVMVPMSCVGNAVMNDSHTTAGAYAGSKMWTTTIPKYAAAIQAAFGSSHVLTHRAWLTNTMNSSTPSMAGNGWNGASTNGSWTDVVCSLMTEPMVYGTASMSSSAYDIMCGKKQFALFRHNNGAINIRADYWLSAVVVSVYFALCGHSGDANYAGAAYSTGVRPYFLLR